MPFLSQNVRFIYSISVKKQTLINLFPQKGLLSSYNKMENHIFQYQKEETDLKEFITEYLEENEAFIREYSLEIGLYAEEGAALMMDRGAFKRILDNLLTNSIRYREKNQSRIEIRVQKKEGRIFWSVADDGPGWRRTVWKRYLRVSAGWTRSGLTAVKAAGWDLPL